MTTSEMIIPQEKTPTLETRIPEITVRRIVEGDLPAVKDLMTRNTKNFVRGGIIPDGLYRLIESEVNTEQYVDTRHRMGIWLNSDKIVGYVGIVPTDELPDTYDYSVDVTCAVDQEYEGRGFGTAAIEAVSKVEIEKGNKIGGETVVEYEDRSDSKIAKDLGAIASMRTGNTGVFVQTNQK